MIKTIEINLFNHPSTKGIEDYIHYLRYTFQKHEFDVYQTNLKSTGRIRVKNKKDVQPIIIEFAETASTYANIDLNNTFIVATEFLGENGFNQFLDKDKELDGVLNKMPLEKLKRYISIAREGKPIKKEKNIINKMIRLSFKSTRLLIKDARLTVLLIKDILKGNSVEEFGYRISLNLRYRHFNKFKNEFKGIIVGSQELYNNYKLKMNGGTKIIYLPPIIPIDNIKPKMTDDINIFFSGRLTDYRKEALGSLTDCYEITNMPCNKDDDYKNNGCGNILLYANNAMQKNAELTHEIYIGQSREWKYASPMRTYRSLRMGYIPISDKLYEGEMYEVSVLPSIDNYETLMRKIVEYNLWALKKSKEAVKNLIN